MTHYIMGGGGGGGGQKTPVSVKSPDFLIFCQKRQKKVSAQIL